MATVGDGVDELLIRELVTSIKKTDCVLLLGPGVAVDPAGDHVPLNTLLAQQLAADPKVQRQCSSKMRANLRLVALLDYEIYRSRPRLEVATREFFGRFKGQTTDFHRHLAALPFKLCISTTPDEFMAQAFRGAGKVPTHAHYNYKRAAQDVTTPPDVDRPLVYALGGCCDDEASLVLTESDLIDFVVSIVRGDPPLPAFVKGRLGDHRTTFLFVGFEFQNWYLRVLLRVLGIYGHESKAIALEDERFFRSPEQPQTLGFFSGDRMIDFHPLHWESFSRRLREAYEVEAAQSRSATGGAVAPPPGAPVVFLCHASEDREAVLHLGDALRERGISVWLDRQRLRGGQRWDQVLVDVINRQVDYVVVVQSQRMVDRPEGYYRKEIKVALDRQSKFDETRYKFIVPVQLGGAETMPELTALQTEFRDVASDEGVDALARTVREDWEQPHRQDARCQGGA
jgi:hypothetical protein